MILNGTSCSSNSGTLLSILWHAPYSSLRLLKAEYTVSVKKYPLRFSDIFPRQLGIYSPNFTHLLYVPIYARLQIFYSITCNF